MVSPTCGMEQHCNYEKLKIYIAAPLFSEMEKRFNLEVGDFLQKIGFDTYLPQLNGGLYSDLIRENILKADAKEMIFKKNLEAIKTSDIFLFILDGRVPDEGACVELGIAFILGKACIGFKTDSRTVIDGEDNLMISQILQGRIARNFSELKEILDKI